MHRIGLILLAAIAGAQLAATAHAVEQRDIPQPTHNYAGWNADHTGWMNLALFQVQTGVQMFYRVHERWPTSWAEVVQSGIWQAPVKGYGNQILDPDQTTFAFGDLHYDISTTPPTLRLYEIEPKGKVSERTVQIVAPRTYRELFALVDRDYDGELNTQLDDTKRMTNFAILGGLTRCLALYKTVHGGYPETLKEFLTSGYAPVTESSLNPITNKPYIGDGTEYDVLYKRLISRNGEPSYQLTHVLANGELPQVGFSY